MALRVTILFLTGLLIFPVGSVYSQKSNAEASQVDQLPYSPSNRPRMVAEWEPAQGVLIAWPLSIPKELVIELANDTKIWLLVDSHRAKQEAIQWLTQWRILPDRVKFIQGPQGTDVSWTRDWGPHAVFTPTGDLVLADPRYQYATPLSGLDCTDSLKFLYHDQQGRILLTREEDELPQQFSTQSSFELITLPFAFTGGNVITDGQRTGFSTCILANENRYLGFTDEQFFNEVQRHTGIDRYHLISNFEDNGIQHIDCLIKLLDEERMLVLRPPADHPDYAQYEGIVQHELTRFKNAYDRPYQILRIDTERYHNDQLAAYTNALILNHHIYVPLFGIPHDSIALHQWAAAMPGYTIKGFAFPLTHEPYYREQLYELYQDIGWYAHDALHCRTRAIWDPEIVYVSVNRVPAVNPKAKSYPVTVIIKDYSDGQLSPDQLALMWRLKGESAWQKIILEPAGYPDLFKADIPGRMAGVTIEYYVSAASSSGTVGTAPPVAPKGFYSFRVE
jgi:agmatine/peptidylarginine deiminase